MVLVQVLVNGHGISKNVVIIFSLSQVAFCKLFMKKSDIFKNALASLYKIPDDLYMSKKQLKRRISIGALSQNTSGAVLFSLTVGQI